MEITTLLSQLWGPVILAVAVGVLMNRVYYTRIYRDLEKETLAMLIFGMMAMAAGIAQILNHNVWDTLPQIVISVLGWGLFIKGLLSLIAPKFLDQVGDGWVNMKLIPYAGVLMLILGGYLSWFGYLA